jgi:hypothetical protein
LRSRKVRLLPVSFTLESAFGSVEPLSDSDDFERQVREVKEERAERAVRKMRGQ